MANQDSTALHRYKRKRNFDVTSEPLLHAATAGEELTFVIQKHWSRRLQYDFRLELDGVLVSWAPTGQVIDLMEALRASLAKGGKGASAEPHAAKPASKKRASPAKGKPDTKTASHCAAALLAGSR